MVVFSHTSLNPIEGEAVVAEVLLHGTGVVELVDVSEQLPQLHRFAGLNQWKDNDVSCGEGMSH